MIWDEVGEDQFEREKVLLDLEQECLELYRRKVDYANMARARLHQELALAESESTHLLLSLGERSLPGRVHQFKSLQPNYLFITILQRIYKISRVDIFKSSQVKNIHTNEFFAFFSCEVDLSWSSYKLINYYCSNSKRRRREL